LRNASARDSSCEKLLSGKAHRIDRSERIPTGLRLSFHDADETHHRNVLWQFGVTDPISTIDA
jgi:hypothetical protein